MNNKNISRSVAISSLLTLTCLVYAIQPISKETGFSGHAGLGVGAMEIK